MPDIPERRYLLERLLQAPDLGQVVPRLRPEALHRVIRRHGLEDCAEVIAHATPEQLARVFDLDLWRANRGGRDEQFDAARFGLWIEVLVEAGPEVAAQRLAEMDVDLVVIGLAQHARVFDAASGREESVASEVGGYLFVPRRAGAWDAIVTALTALSETHEDFFHRAMRGVRALSNSKPEADGFHDVLDAPEQAMFDLATAREQRREEQGFATPAQARALLQMWRAHRPRPPSAKKAAAHPPQPPADMLRRRRRYAHLQRYLEVAGERDDVDLLSARTAELAELANVVVAGCSFQGRAFTPQEAADAAAAVCNLGLENAREDPDTLTAAFQIGWAILYQDVCSFAAERLIAVVAGLRCRDRQIQSALDRLSVELKRYLELGTPWRARHALDAIAMLDLASWTALLALIDECPVIHAALRASVDRQTRPVSASAFEFIAENRHIAVVREFLQSLPARLY